MALQKIYSRRSENHLWACRIRTREKAQFLCQSTGNKHATAQIRHVLNIAKAHFRHSLARFRHGLGTNIQRWALF